MTNDEINVMVQELNFIIGVLRKVPDVSSLANHSQELLSVEIQRKPRKTYLKALKKEMLVVARETMSPKGWGRLKAVLSFRRVVRRRVLTENFCEWRNSKRG